MPLTHPVCIRGVIHADISAPHKRRQRRCGGAWCASSCPSYPAPPPPSRVRKSQSQLSIQQQLGGDPRPKQCLLQQRRTRPKEEDAWRASTIAFGTQRATDQVSSQFLVGLLAPRDSQDLSEVSGMLLRCIANP